MEAGASDNMFNKTGHPLLGSLGVVLATFFPEAVKLHGEGSDIAHFSDVFKSGKMNAVADEMDKTAIGLTDTMSGLCQTRDNIDQAVMSGKPLKAALAEGLATMQICIAGMEDVQAAVGKIVEGLRSEIEEGGELSSKTGTEIRLKPEITAAKRKCQEAENEEKEEEKDEHNTPAPEAAEEIEVITSE